MRAWGIFACLLVASCAGAGSERVVRPERQYVPSDVAAQASDPTHETIGGKGRSVAMTTKDVVVQTPAAIRTTIPRPRPPPR
jgi:hypothetical protein